jgi:hypothetical protein
MQNQSLGVDSLESPPTSNCENDQISADIAKSLSATQQNFQHYFATGSEGQKRVSTAGFLSLPPSTAEHRQRSRSQCVSACTTIIEHLDVKIQADVTALDEVLDVNKTAVREIARIMSLEQYKESASCPQLISIALGQIITLFESCIHSVGFPLNNLNTIPRFHFGAFQFDREEQLSLCAHIICKELRRCSQVLATLKSTLRNPLMQDAESVILYDRWSANMGRRLETLITTVEESCRR